MSLPHLLLDAARRLLRRPLQSLLTVMVLGLGLGATLFLLAVISGVLLEPLPFPERDRLVAVGELQESGVGGISGDDYLLLRQSLTRFDRFGTYDEQTANLSRGGDHLAKRYEGAALGGATAELIGLKPLLGRGFTAADDQPGAPPVLLLGEAVWRADFGADPAVIGQVLRLNGQPATVIGVLPADFRFPFIAEVWMPRRIVAGDDYSVQVMARLASGATLTEARAELEAVVATLGIALETVREERPLGLKPLSLRFVNESTRQHVGMMVLPGLLVLLLACLNAANLRLGEAMGRQSELAVRAALGAGRGRMLQELLAETFWLALCATAIGLAIAELGCRWLMATLLAADDAPVYYIQLGVDLRLLWIAAGVALLTTLLAGLWPAWRASQQALPHSLRQSRNGGASRVVQALVVAEIAFTVILLVGAGTFLRGMDRVLAFDFGTRAAPEAVLTGRIGLREARYAEPEAKQAFYQRLRESLAAEPGVRAVSMATALPGTSAGGAAAVAVEGTLPDVGAPRALLAHVDAGFAAVYDLSLREGRFIEARDDATAAPVAVIDQRLAAQLWPDGRTLGQTLVLNPREPEPRRYTVIGVVDALHLEDADDPVRPTALLSLAQHPAEFFTVALRTHGGDAAGYAPRLAETLRMVDADLPVYWLRTQAEAITMGRVGPLVLTQMFTVVGALGLLLAAAGIYGVLTQAVHARRREIGVRRAVGADSASVVRLVAGSIGRQLALGLGIGLAIALPWTGTLESELFQTRAGEPSVLLGSLLVVLIATALATAAPLRRALQVDPLVALRAE